MALEQDELLKAQQIIATSVEIAKSLPEYEGIRMWIISTYA